MTIVLDRPSPPAEGAARARLGFKLPEERIADGPVERHGGRRDDARLLVAWRSDERLVDARMADLPRYLRAGDVLVVNTSATLAAAVPTTEDRLLHLSTELPGGLWVVEVRRRCRAGSLPFPDARPGQSIPLPGGGRAHLLATFPAGAAPGPTTPLRGPLGPTTPLRGPLGPTTPLRGPLGPTRLMIAQLELPTTPQAYLAEFGRPIRYGCPDTSWPLTDYQTVFATHPGSAEMASAGRPFTPDLVTALASAGVVFAPVTLHTGVSSQEAGEPPYPERYRVPATTAELVNGARERGHRVVAVGTTATRALETVGDGSGRAHPGAGWTELVITPERGVRVVDAVLTGWHEPEASHLQLLEAVAGRATLERSYAHALAGPYLWHEFGDVHLVLP